MSYPIRSASQSQPHFSLSDFMMLYGGKSVEKSPFDYQENAANKGTQNFPAMSLIED